MKEKVIKLGNENYYVLDELSYKEKRYVFLAECDANEEDLTDNYSVAEVRINGDELIVNKIEDFEIASVVNNLFLARLNQGE